MVIIDAYRGGRDTGYTGNGLIEKDFNLKISKYIYDRLKSLGVNVFMTRENDSDLNINERSDLIKNAFGNNSNVVAISNRLNYGDENGVEILYSLKNSNTLANKIDNAFEERDIYVNKIYQRRDENDTSTDYDDLQKNTGNVQTIIINYGYINDTNDANKLKNDYVKYAEAVIKSLATQFGVPYSYALNNEYIVQKGDSLWSISNKFGLTVDELKSANNLTSNLLSIGQILQIPSKESVSTPIQNTYVVQKGDSLYQIALKNNTTVDELKSLNNLTSNLLSIGQVLKLPSKESVSTPSQSIYVVQKGDSLYQIALKNNTTVDELKSLNNLTSNLLSIGQVLKLPSKTQNTYIVKKGDSLWLIAKNNNTTVDKIKSLNNLTSNLLSIGQELILP